MEPSQGLGACLMWSTPGDCERQMPGTKVASHPLVFLPKSAHSHHDNQQHNEELNDTGLNSTTCNSCLLNRRWLGFSVAPPRCGVLGPFHPSSWCLGCSAFLQQMPCPKEPHSKTHRRELKSEKSHSQDKDSPIQEGFREITLTPEQSAATSSPNLEPWVLIYRLQGRLTASSEMTF